MNVRVELSEGDISDAIKEFVERKMRMKPVGAVTLTKSKPNSEDVCFYSASVMAEVLTQNGQLLPPTPPTPPTGWGSGDK